MTADDIKKIPDIIRNYNDVYYVPSSDGKKSGLIYRYDNGSTTYYLEEVNDSNGVLRNKQMIKVPLGKVPDIKNLRAAIEIKNAAALPGDAAGAVPRMYVQDVRRGAEAEADVVSGSNLASIGTISHPAQTVNSEINHGAGAAETGFTQPGHETNQVPSRAQALTGSADFTDEARADAAQSVHDHYRLSNEQQQKPFPLCRARRVGTQGT